MPRKIWSLVVVLLAFLVRTDALGFSTYGETWQNAAGNPVIYRIQPAGSDDIDDGSDLQAVRNAFTTWDSVACSHLDFAEGPWMDPPVAALDNVNRIMWIENRADWTDSPAILALTYAWPSGGNLVDADMRINGVDFRWTTREAEVGQGTPARADLETTLFHEAGHFLGLDHSQDPMAAMFAVANVPIRRGPSLDDLQGVCTLYPNGNNVPGPGSGSVGSPCLTNTDCTSSLCANDQQIGRMYCTATCGPSSPCPMGYVCETVESGSYCLVPFVPDELCDQCAQGSQCSSGFCVNVNGANNGQPFCSKPCDPTPGQVSQCPGGYSCVPLSDAAIGGVCAPNNGVCEARGKGGQNESCFANGTCKPGLRCVNYFPDNPGLGLRFCYVECPIAYAGQSCTTDGGTQCADIGDNLAVCFNVAHEGEPCVPELCDSTGFCAYDRSPDEASCYRRCDQGQTCGANTQCQQQRDGLPPLCIPLPGTRREGQACMGDEECASRRCRTYGQNRLCTKPCSITDPVGCGRGLKCLPDSGSSSMGQCWPESFQDLGAQDPSRNVLTSPSSFCACDSTHSCDADCPCDPECAKAGCGCSSTTGEQGGLALLGLALLGLIFGRRRR